MDVAAFSVVVNGVVLLLLAGVIVGHLARPAAEVEVERRHVIEVEAASRERERLARDIHDSVLQVLALVGGWAGCGPAPSVPGDVDLRAVIMSAQTDRVTVSVPAQDCLTASTRCSWYWPWR